MKTRRKILAALLAVAVSPLAFAATTKVTPPTVEIVAMPHPPVKSALAPLRDWLSAQGNKLRVTEIDSESPEGVRRMQAAGLTGHIPILILVDGQYRHKRKDGNTVAFVNFPNVEGTPPGARGDWTTADVQAVLKERLKGR